MSSRDDARGVLVGTVDDPGQQPWVPSQALIAMGPHSGAVLQYHGSAIEGEISEAGLHALDELGLDDAPVGLSVWEGEFVYEPGYVDGHEMPGEGQTQPAGKFRPLTDEEWDRLRKGEALW